MLENVDYIKEILVIGGETLVYPWLSDVLDFCRSQGEDWEIDHYNKRCDDTQRGVS